MRLVGAALLLAVLLHYAGPSQSHNKPGTRHNRAHAIIYAFCGHQYRPCPLGYKALSVAYCESGPNLWHHARNGQYLGMFQFGSYARSTFGFSWSPWAQALSAFRYYRVSGWSPWTCA